MIYYYREMTNYIFCVLVSRHLTKCGIKSGITILKQFDRNNLPDSNGIPIQSMIPCKAIL